MKRSCEGLLQESLRHFPCVAVLGPRQCGKTTLLASLGEKWRIFDLEKGSDLEQIGTDPDLFLRMHPNATAIDEAQAFPERLVAIPFAFL